MTPHVTKHIFVFLLFSAVLFSSAPASAQIDSLFESIPDSAVAYMDSVPEAEVDFRDATLPNEENLHRFLKRLKRRQARSETDEIIFVEESPQEILSQVIAQFLDRARYFSDDRNHSYSQGFDDTEPAQVGLAYNYGSRESSQRYGLHRRSPTVCNLKVYGLDCSGFMFQLFEKAGCRNMDRSAADMSTVPVLNGAISQISNQLEAKDMGKLYAADIMSGDIIYWNKLSNSPASHIGIALKEGNSIKVFQSNGSGNQCNNTIASRGPRPLALTDGYFFSDRSNWKVLRFVVRNPQ